MICIFWNTSGLANTPTKLALQRIILCHKLDFLLVAEPWMNYEHFPQIWQVKHGLKLISLNNRHNALPNLWCFCKIYISPTIISVTDQYVAFSSSLNGKFFGIIVVYASTNYLVRITLWHKLSSLLQTYKYLWCIIGDFNVILGGHEYKYHTSYSIRTWCLL